MFRVTMLGTGLAIAGFLGACAQPEPQKMAISGEPVYNKMGELQGCVQGNQSVPCQPGGGCQDVAGAAPCVPNEQYQPPGGNGGDGQTGGNGQTGTNGQTGAVAG
ncbi:MAG: hypothetical protein FH759_01275 [Sediminimonas qiaohouensis]|uniref:Collagen-like protein n=1 Tax=Sediminimonas qiaohouensis TaxID=552061 RepID=A0A7C9H9B5_9RHOB|nr:hypothetical protein [Sediminimonas qiaohouensis]MTJ03311.1 hypothetical protein [Sediminimonas qiaohouensis]